MTGRLTRRILVVDDEASVRNSLAGFLEDCGCTVAMAASAEEALTMLAHTPFDVAIVDLRLPDMNGDALILEAHGWQPSLRFLIHTGSVSFHLSDELHQIGISQAQIFLKPIADLNLLVQGIDRLLADGLAVPERAPVTGEPPVDVDESLL